MAVATRQTTKRHEAVRARAERVRQRGRHVMRAAAGCRFRGHGSGVDGVKVFDHQAQRLLGISGDEFLRNLDAGVYRSADPDEARAARRLAMLLPLVRRVPV